MADKNGHWVTYNGRHIFFSDDPTEKQEKEIADSQKRVDDFNKGKTEKVDPVKSNALYKGLEKKTQEVLGLSEQSLGELNEKSARLYELLGSFAKAGISDGDTYNAVKNELHRIEATTNMGYVNTGRYDSELKKDNDKRAKKQKSDAQRSANVEKLRKENPNDYVTRYGIVLKGHNRSLDDLKKAAGDNQEVHFVDGRAENAEHPAGTIAKHNGWKGISDYNFDDSLEWGWFTDTDGKKKIWFYLSD